MRLRTGVEKSGVQVGLRPNSVAIRRVRRFPQVAAQVAVDLRMGKATAHVDGVASRSCSPCAGKATVRRICGTVTYQRYCSEFQVPGTSYGGGGGPYTWGRGGSHKLARTMHGTSDNSPKFAFLFETLAIMEALCASKKHHLEPLKK
jgi:hypothetical protein